MSDELKPGTAMDARVCEILGIEPTKVRHSFGHANDDGVAWCIICGQKDADTPAGEACYESVPAVSTSPAFIPTVKAAMVARFCSTTITTRFNGIGYTADMDCRESPGMTENHALCNLAIDLEQEEKEDR